MKFGGTLLASEAGLAQVANIVSKSRREHRLVLVVSALGDVTDMLIEASESAKKWKEPRIDLFVNQLRVIHTEALKRAQARSTIDSASSQVEELLRDLKVTLLGVSMLGELTPRSSDLILSFGERLSAVVVSAAMTNRSIPTRALTGGEAGIITDNTFGEAAPVFAKTRREVGKTLAELVSKGVVPVVTGFIAQSESGEITTLGRGGSDYSATIIADAIAADEVWIWTDVDGIMTADPRVVRTARVIEELSYAEAEEMAFFGAKNMHPLALGPAMLHKIPVRIRNGFRPANQGTLIHVRERTSANIAKAVALVNNVGMLTISGETLLGRPGTAAKVFQILGENGINVLMISQSVSESNISTIVRRSQLEKASLALSGGLGRQGIRARIQAESDVAVLAVVGAGMKGTPGVAARVFTAVASTGVNVRMIAQGSSELNISFVVRSKDSARAVRALHRTLVLSQ
jgi:aspartate kinase